MNKYYTAFPTFAFQVASGCSAIAGLRNTREPELGNTSVGNAPGSKWIYPGKSSITYTGMLL